MSKQKSVNNPKSLCFETFLDLYIQQSTMILRIYGKRITLSCFWGPQIFQKSKNHLHILGNRRVP